MKTSNNFHTRIEINRNATDLAALMSHCLYYFWRARKALKDETDEIFRCQLIEKQIFV